MSTRVTQNGPLTGKIEKKKKNNVRKKDFFTDEATVKVM